MKSFLLLIALVLFIHPLVKATTLDSTSIALVVIDTKGIAIQDEPKIPATMKIFYRGEGKMNRMTDIPVYEGNIGIEIRGSFSATLPQKSYGIETKDALGNAFNISLLGLPTENDWILLANYNDKTFVRAPLAYNLFQEMGHWASHSFHCEVILNGEYRGIYTLQEKIKRDKNRVDIEKIDKIDDTGGYIFKHDNNSKGDLNWNSDYGVNFIYVYPKPEDITYEQKEYLRNYISSFEKVLSSNSFADPLTGYSAYIDVTSFYDYFIIGELSRNVDAYKKSSFFDKDNRAVGGLIHAGPVWDLDWAMKDLYDGSSTCFCRNTDGSGWAYIVEDCGWGGTPASWMSRLLQDPTFANNLHHRYFELRKNVLSRDNIFSYIDSVRHTLNIPQQRHYETWPILGERVGAPEIGTLPDTYYGELDKLKHWLDLRLIWLDENMLGSEPTSVSEIKESSFRVFPNPCHDILYVESTQSIASIAIYGIDGTMRINSLNVNSPSMSLNLSQLTNGLYLVKIQFSSGEIQNTKLVIE
ncbi:CotH kinase family protein [Sunxiuqinia sp. A32]|uniref:CotH kinase family protein n=1 Tax=Sunxiuqinia sp. A32 TaxID=3461496 RepID=UPI00404543D5